MPHIFFKLLEKRRSTQSLIGGICTAIYACQTPYDPNSGVNIVPIYAAQIPDQNINIYGVPLYAMQLPDPGITNIYGVNIPTTADPNKLWNTFEIK